MDHVLLRFPMLYQRKTINGASVYAVGFYMAYTARWTGSNPSIYLPCYSLPSNLPRDHSINETE